VALLVLGGSVLCVVRPAVAGDDETVLDYPHLTAAYRKSLNPKLLYQLGALAAAEGRSAEAQDLMRRYLAELSVESSTPEAKAAEQVASGVRVPSGEVDILGERGALVLVDDRLVGSLPLSLPLLVGAGEHQIQVERGRHHVKTPIKVLEGRGTVIRVNLSSHAAVVSQPPAVVLLPDFATDPALSLRLFRLAEKGVRRANHAVFNTTVAKAHAPEQNPCLGTMECQVKLGQRNEIEFVLSMRVAAAGASNKPDYSLSLRLLDVSAGDFSAQVEKSCRACDAEQLGTAMSDAVAEAFQTGVGRTRGTLALGSQPPGATVLLAGRSLGVTPYLGPAWVGSQEVTVSLPGYLDERLTVTVAAGTVASYAVQLKPGVQPSAPPSAAAPASASVSVRDPNLIAGRPRGRFIAGAVITGVGVVGLFAGIGLVVNNLLCFDFTGTGACSGASTNVQIGGAVAGGGIVVALTGALLMGVPGKKKPSPN
jgi:hypothetical protein